MIIWHFKAYLLTILIMWGNFSCQELTIQTNIYATTEFYYKNVVLVQKDQIWHNHQLKSTKLNLR